LPSKIGAYDNAADFPADVPTYAHYLRRLGYRTALSGKMHFAVRTSCTAMKNA
jgi:choline-sulfatase